MKNNQGDEVLILTRRVGEEIYIDRGRLKIKVLSERGGIIRLGVQAPPDIEVDRKEIFIRKWIERQGIKKQTKKAPLPAEHAPPLSPSKPWGEGKNPNAGLD